MPNNPSGRIDTATGGEGLAGFSALAEDAPEWDDGPFEVHGVAIGEGDVTEGLSGERVFWPRETLEPATEALVGKKIVDDREHDDLEATQPSVENIIGEVTDAQYEPGVGVAYSGEIDDPEIAKQVDRGRLDPSPMLFRETGEFDDERDAHTATEIRHWRDIATVSDGASPSASIQPGAAAMGASALRSAFADGSGGEGNSDEQPANEPAESGTDADDNTTAMDLTETEEDLVRAARSTDDPTVVPAQTQALAEQAQEHGLPEYDDPTVVEADTHERRQETITAIDDFLTDRLAEIGEERPSEAAAMSVGEKFERFEDDDGDLEAEALVQNPEAGGSDDAETADADEPNGDPEALSAGERSDVADKLRRADLLEDRTPEHAESLRAEAAAAVGVESHEDIDMEAL